MLHRTYDHRFEPTNKASTLNKEFPYHIKRSNRHIALTKWKCKNVHIQIKYQTVDQLR